MRHRLSSLGLVLMFLGGCGGGSAPGAGSVAGDGCPALVTWQQAQQRYLDILTDISIDDYRLPSIEVLQAGTGLGGMLLEAAREATSFDCENALFVGSPELCDTINRLEASGPSAEVYLSTLTASCS